MIFIIGIPLHHLDHLLYSLDDFIIISPNFIFRQIMIHIY